MSSGLRISALATFFWELKLINFVNWCLNMWNNWERNLNVSWEENFLKGCNCTEEMLFSEGVEVFLRIFEPKRWNLLRRSNFSTFVLFFFQDDRIFSIKNFFSHIISIHYFPHKSSYAILTADSQNDTTISLFSFMHYANYVLKMPVKRPLISC